MLRTKLLAKALTHVRPFTAAKRLPTTLAAILWMFNSSLSFAENFPVKPLQVVIPNAPGGASDIAMRLLQPHLQKRLGQVVVVDYKPGAGGKIAAQYVARSNPDGYTLFLGATNSFVIDQFLSKDYIDPLVDLIPLIKLAEVPAVLFSSSEMRASSWDEFERATKKTNRQLNFASPGIGTTPHLSSLLLANATGLSITHVPYRGAQLAIQALLSNDVQLYLGAFGPLEQFVAERRVNALAVVSDRRLPGMPNVPTVKEAGVPDVLANNWFAMAVPKGTPQSVVDRLTKELGEILEIPAVREAYLAQGLIASGLTGKPLYTELVSEAKHWREIIANEGLGAN